MQGESGVSSICFKTVNHPADPPKKEPSVCLDTRASAGWAGLRYVYSISQNRLNLNRIKRRNVSQRFRKNLVTLHNKKLRVKKRKAL